MNFLLYSVLTEQNEQHLADFINEANDLKLPIRTLIIDARSKSRSFDETYRTLRRFRNSHNYVMRASTVFDAHKTALFHARSETYTNCVYVDLVNKVEEIPITTLLVRSNDCNCAVPFSQQFSEYGVQMAVQTKTDFIPVWTKPMETEVTNAAIIPTSVFALNKGAIQILTTVDHSSGEDFELYRLFTVNNVKATLIDTVFFNLR
jgi:hypothetical protein